MCQGLTENRGVGLDLASASRSLGEQRVEVGTYLDEARADLAIGLDLAGIGRHRTVELLDAMTVGWAERSVDRQTAAPLTDRTGATVSYLALRLAELYREAALTGERVGDRHLLVVVDTAEAPARLTGEAWLLAVHSALQYAFVGGETIVTVTAARAAVLCGREQPRLDDSLARLRSELKIALAESRLPSARCWQQRLPDDAALLRNTVLQLCY